MCKCSIYIKDIEKIWFFLYIFDILLLSLQSCLSCVKSANVRLLSMIYCINIKQTKQCCQWANQTVKACTYREGGQYNARLLLAAWQWAAGWQGSLVNTAATGVSNYSPPSWDCGQVVIHSWQHLSECEWSYAGCAGLSPTKLRLANASHKNGWPIGALQLTHTITADNFAVCTFSKSSFRYSQTQNRNNTDLVKPCLGASRPVHSTGIVSYLSKLIPFGSVSNSASSYGGNGGTYGGICSLWPLPVVTAAFLTAKDHRASNTAIRVSNNI